MTWLSRTAVFVLVAAMLTSACASSRSFGPAHVFSGSEQPIDIEIRNLSFSPNHLAILRGGAPADIRLSNTDDTWHDFTLTDPQQRIILSKKVVPKESISIELDSLKPGNYVFYCNRILHRLQGGEGMLMID